MEVVVRFAKKRCTTTSNEIVFRMNFRVVEVVLGEILG